MNMEANNKEINEILGVMDNAMGEIKAIQCGKNKVGVTYCGMLDRMMGQLKAES